MDDIRGTVIDYGGGEIRIQVHRDTRNYFDLGTKVAIHRDEAERPSPSPYSRVFDETNENWRRDKNLNLLFLQSQQNYMNHRLRRNGHVFLNEVYDALGFKRTQDGQLAGWLNDDRGYVFFDLSNFDEFGLIDFNVDGVIYDKLPTS
jgi:hypothetical protein